MQHTTATTQTPKPILQLTHEEAIEFFAEFFRGKHHIPAKLKENGYGWEVSTTTDLSTYDFDRLTRLVLLAHRNAIRVSLDNGGPRRMKIIIHKRLHNREERMARRHPSLLDLCDMAEALLPVSECPERRANLSWRVRTLTEFLDSKGIIDEYEDWCHEKDMQLKHKHES